MKFITFLPQDFVSCAKFPIAGLGVETTFPILSEVGSRVHKGDKFRIIAIVGNGDTAKLNLSRLEEELAELCAHGFDCPNGIEIVDAAPDHRVGNHISVFQKLKGLIEDGDELVADITFGTVPEVMTLENAMRFGVRLMRNVSIRAEVCAPDLDGSIADYTAMFQLDEIIGLLGAREVEDPDRAIQAILAL